MLKAILPTPDLYRATQDKNKPESNALLPPGLINHGNTCFMNSVLQGVSFYISALDESCLALHWYLICSSKLIATQYMDDLFHSRGLPSFIQPIKGPRISMYRSPLLTNGHGLAASPYEHDKSDDMPLGDVFVTTMRMAWDAQMKQSFTHLSPRCDNQSRLS